jgi:hypothetical protein
VSAFSLPPWVPCAPPISTPQPIWKFHFNNIRHTPTSSKPYLSIMFSNDDLFVKSRTSGLWCHVAIWSHHEDRDSTVLRNVAILHQYTVSQPRGPRLEWSLTWKTSNFASILHAFIISLMLTVGVHAVPGSGKMAANQAVLMPQFLAVGQ